MKYYSYIYILNRTLCIDISKVITFNSTIIFVSEQYRYETAYACEGKTLKIECKDGEVIKLIRANYGRFSITICNDHGNTDWSVNCMSPKSLRVLHTRQVTRATYLPLLLSLCVCMSLLLLIPFNMIILTSLSSLQYGLCHKPEYEIYSRQQF